MISFWDHNVVSQVFPVRWLHSRWLSRLIGRSGISIHLNNFEFPHRLNNWLFHFYFPFTAGNSLVLGFTQHFSTRLNRAYKGSRTTDNCFLHFSPIIENNCRTVTVVFTDTTNEVLQISSKLSIWIKRIFSVPSHVRSTKCRSKILVLCTSQHAKNQLLLWKPH